MLGEVLAVFVDQVGHRLDIRVVIQEVEVAGVRGGEARDEGRELCDTGVAVYEAARDDARVDLGRLAQSAQD